MITLGKVPRTIEFRSLGAIITQFATRLVLGSFPCWVAEVEAVPVDHFAGLQLDAPLADEIESGRAFDLSGIVANPDMTEILFSFSPQSGGEDVDFFISHLRNGRFWRSVVFDHAQAGSYTLNFYAGRAGESLPFVGAYSPFVVSPGSGAIQLPRRFFDGLLLDEPLPTEFPVGRVFRFSGQLEDDRIRGLSLELTRSDDTTRELAAAFEGRRFHLLLRLHPDEVGEGHLTLFVELADGLLWDRGEFGIRGVDPNAPDLEVGVLAVSLLPQTSTVIPVSNRGTVALKILELRVEGPFDVVAAPASVPALSTAGVELAYTGAGGEQGTLILRTDDPVRPDVAVALSGLAAAEVPIGLQRLRAAGDGVLSLDLDFSENDYALALFSGQVFDIDTEDVYGFTAGGPLVVAKALLLPDPQTTGNAFEAALRRREAELAQRIRLQGLPVAKRAAVDYRPGDQRSFVFSESERLPEQVLSATVVHVNDKAVAFVDDNLRPRSDNATTAEIAAYVDRFAEDYDLIVDVFGPPSDVDGDGKITFLFTHLVDDAGPAGFFEAESVIAAEVGGNGNRTDMLFLSPTADPRAYRSLLVHELQHLISFSQHVLLRFGEAEVSWLNEGLSHYAEDLVDGHVDGDVSSLVQSFLRHPSRVGLRGDANNDDGLRGAAYLFVRSLVDRLGRDIVLRLLQTGLADRDNIEEATGEKFEDLLAFWAAQLFASGNGLIDHRRLNYDFALLRAGEDRGFRMPATLIYRQSGPPVSGILQPRGVNFMRLTGASRATVRLATDPAGLVGAVVLPLAKDFIAKVHIPVDYFPGISLAQPLPAVFETGEPFVIKGTIDVDGPAQIVIDFVPHAGGETFSYFIIVDGGPFERAIVFDHSRAGTYEVSVFAGLEGDSLLFVAGFSPVEILPGSGPVMLPRAYFNGVRLDQPLPTMFGVGAEIPVAGSLQTAASSTVLFEFVPEGAGQPLDFAFDAEGGRFEGTLDFDIADSGLYRLEVYVGPAGEELTYVGASEVEVAEFVVTAVVEDEIPPHAFALAQNFPNPFNGETAIRFALPDGAAASRAELTVYDLLGQPVVTLVRGPLPPGEHLVRWDGRDEAGRKLASGLYVYRLNVGSRALMRKLLLVQ